MYNCLIIDIVFKNYNIFSENKFVRFAKNSLNKQYLVMTIADSNILIIQKYKGGMAIKCHKYPSTCGQLCGNPQQDRCLFKPIRDISITPKYS